MSSSSHSCHSSNSSSSSSNNSNSSSSSGGGGGGGGGGGEASAACGTDDSTLVARRKDEDAAAGAGPTLSSLSESSTSSESEGSKASLPVVLHKRPRDETTGSESEADDEAETQDSLVPPRPLQLHSPPSLPPDSKADEVAQPRVCVMWSAAYLRYLLLFPTNKLRDVLLAELLCAYKMQQHVRFVAPKFAASEDLMRFHCPEYVQILNQAGSGKPVKVDKLLAAGLVDDCPVFPGLALYCSAVAGATLGAANELLSGNATVAMNWGGGRHHAKTRKASGYCYVNDVVLGVLRLQSHFERILVVDMDVHHGDGVEEAFLCSKRVMTLSLHHCAPGYFPGTGSNCLGGVGAGKGYTVNVPLASGVDDTTYVPCFRMVLRATVQAHRPEAIVFVCGADALAGDPLGKLNLSSNAYIACMQAVLAVNVPTLVLGGGGYHAANTARCFTLLTATAAGILSLDPNRVLETPHATEFMTPNVGLHVPATCRQNMTDRATLQHTMDAILAHLRRLGEEASVAAE